MKLEYIDPIGNRYIVSSRIGELVPPPPFELSPSDRWKIRQVDYDRKGKTGMTEESQGNLSDETRTDSDRISETRTESVRIENDRVTECEIFDMSMTPTEIAEFACALRDELAVRGWTSQDAVVAVIAAAVTGRAGCP